MVSQVNVTDSTKSNQTITQGAWNGAKAIAITMTGPNALPLFCNDKDFVNGDSFERALDNTLDQVASNYKNVSSAVIEKAKKVAKQAAEGAETLYEESKPKDKVELVILGSNPPAGPVLIPVKRAIVAFVDYIQKQWNSLPLLAK